MSPIMESRFTDICKWINLTNDVAAKVTETGGLVIALHGRAARFDAEGEMLAGWGLGVSDPRLEIGVDPN
jgi:hypothetical protein